MNSNKIIISIGALSPQQVKDTLIDGRFVVAYEPRKEIYEAYTKINDSNFTCFPHAVSGKAGTTIFHEHGGSSTICDMSLPHYQIDDEYEVEVVAMGDILSKYNGVRTLYLNCEGSEIPILMDTPIELLMRCKHINVEFHQNCPYLNISKEDVMACVKKLEEKFQANLVSKENPYYTFVRRLK